MSEFSRRSFLFASSGAAAGMFAASGLAEAEEPLNVSQSGLASGQPKPLKHKSIPGFLSAEQIAPHYTAHYGGALKGFVAAETRLDESAKGAAAIDTAAFGALKRTINSRGNSVLLHELYFDGLASQPVAPAEDVRNAIARRFGSLDTWTADFIATAKEAAGWAMLVRHPVNGKLYNVVSDEHAMGVLWMAVPLVIVDTYEHAFYIDYQNRKAEYVEKFIAHIDWSETNTRFQQA